MVSLTAQPPQQQKKPPSISTIKVSVPNQACLTLWPRRDLLSVMFMLAVIPSRTLLPLPPKSHHDVLGKFSIWVWATFIATPRCRWTVQGLQVGQDCLIHRGKFKNVGFEALWLLQPKWGCLEEREQKDPEDGQTEGNGSASERGDCSLITSVVQGWSWLLYLCLYLSSPAQQIAMVSISS